MTRVPSKSYALQYEELLPELLPRLERAFLEDDPILGAAVERFERAFAAYLGAKHARGVNSGTDALILALRAARIGPGDEVITAANTFIATISAIAAVGAKPVLVDPDPETLNSSAAGVRAAIGPKTRAVIAVHLYGALAPIEELRSLCDSRGLALLEDAAQAHGARNAEGRRAGTFGLAGCFSFHPSKNLGAFGDGGLVATDDEALAGEIDLLRNLGKRTPHEVERLCGNTKLDTLQAVILELKLPALDARNARRRALAALYRERLQSAGDLRLPHDPGGERHAYHLFVVRTAHRDELRAFLAEHGVHASLHYPIPPHLQALDVDLGYPRGAFPVTESAASEVLSLPISPELTEAQIEHVARAVRAFFADRGTP